MWRVAGIGGLLTLICVLLITGVMAFGKTQPAHIMIYSYQDELYELYQLMIMDVDRQLVYPLPSVKAGSYSPIWSPDGEQIIFVRAGNLFSIRPDGRDLQQLSADATQRVEISMTQDGRRIAYARASNFTYSIEILDILTNEIIRLTESEDFGRFFVETPLTRFPAWSPDGTQLAYQSTLGTHSIVYVANLNATDDRPNPIIDGELARFPAWSPDGQSMAFYAELDGNPGIYIIVDGQPRRLTDHLTDGQPAWSANGQYIAYHSRRDGMWAIYRVNVETSVIERLTGNTGYAYAPQWKP